MRALPQFTGIFLIVATIGSIGHARTRCPMDSRRDDRAARFTIGAGNAEMPIGAFLLIRKNGQFGAIRLTSVDKEATEDYGKSTWESFFQPDSSGSLVANNAIHKTGELNVLPLKGPGRGIYVYQPGVTEAFVGGWKFGFVGPTMIRMSDSSFWKTRGAHGFEFAPTAACDISEVDVHDKRLKWFQFDDNAPRVVLLLADLPR